MREKVVTELTFRLERLPAEVASQQGSVESPSMFLKRKVVPDQSDFVVAACVFKDRRDASAVGALKILKDLTRNFLLGSSYKRPLASLRQSLGRDQQQTQQYETGRQ